MPSYGFGVLTTTSSSENLELNFCIKYYPQLYNLTSNRSEAVIYKLSQLVYLNESDTCSGDKIPDDLRDKIALIPTNASNCTMDTRAQMIASHNASGMLADHPLTSKFNASDYQAKIAVASLYREGDKAIILALKVF